MKHLANLLLLTILVSLTSLFGTPSFAVVIPTHGTWVKNWEELHPFQKYSTKSQIQHLNLPIRKLKQRILKSNAIEYIEPIYISISNKITTQRERINEIIDRYGAPSKVNELRSFLTNHLKNPENIEKKGLKTTFKIKVTKELYKLLDRRSLLKKYITKHHKVYIENSSLRKRSHIRREFLSSLSPYFSQNEIKRINSKIASQDLLSIDRDLLPSFPRKMVGNFIIYRGPNCFHAALAFQSPILTRSSFFNVKREKGYHKAMINYDELWRILKGNFYQIDPSHGKVKYGDLLVFFDLPVNRQPDDVNFKWIRHTSTYLLNQYTFSKGSKSPNTPYSVKTLQEEWKLWKRYTKNLAVKIFRRNSKNVKRTPPKDLMDWIY